MSDKIIKGQALVIGNKIIQSQTKFLESGQVINGDVVILEDVKADLLSSSGSHTYKSKGTGDRKFFYWEYEQTSLDDDTVNVKVFLECPKPTPDWDLEGGSGEWVEYWSQEIKKINERYQKSSTIQPQTHYLAGASYLGPEGILQKENVTVELPEQEVQSTGLGDIQNLLWIF